MHNTLQPLQTPVPDDPATPLTLNRWFDIWLETYKKGHVKPTTIDTYRALYDRHIRGDIGRLLITDFHPIHIQRIYNAFLQLGYSVRYLGTLHSILSGLFRDAEANGLIPENPCSHVELPTGDISERRVLSHDEQHKIQTQLLLPRFRRIEPLVTTLLGTGLRIGEILGLQWRDIHIASEPDKTSTGIPDPVNFLTVNHTLVRVNNETAPGTQFILQSPKTKCSMRSIPLQKRVSDALIRQKNEQIRNQRRPTWSPLPGLEGLVFSGRNGQPQWRSTVVSCIDTVIRSINDEERILADREFRTPVYIDRVLPHAFRHTFATRSLEAGIPPKVVQHWLGHASIKLTLDLYTHVSTDLSAHHMEILEAAMYDGNEIL